MATQAGGYALAADRNTKQRRKATGISSRPWPIIFSKVFNGSKDCLTKVGKKVIFEVQFTKPVQDTFK